MLPEIEKVVRSRWSDYQCLRAVSCAMEEKIPAEEQVLGEDSFLGSLRSTHCGKSCPQNGCRRKSFRGNVRCALKLKEEGCSSSDIAVKRLKVQLQICFLRSCTAP